jgi:hypothetical protein
MGFQRVFFMIVKGKLTGQPEADLLPRELSGAGLGSSMDQGSRAVIDPEIIRGGRQ